MLESEKTTLYLPKYCLVPLAARLDETITSAAAIYLGEINILCSKYGYITYSDQQLAEMKGVSLRTIERFHTMLDRRGFISRTTWKEHVKIENGGLEVRTKRKLYVIETPSILKNIPEPPEVADRSDPPKLADRNEPPKMAGIKEEKKEESKEEKEGVPPKPPARVAKSSIIDKGIERALHVHTTEQEHLKLAEVKGEDARDKAYQRLSEWKQDTPRAKWKKSDYRSINRWVFDSLSENKHPKSFGKSRSNPNLTPDQAKAYDELF